MVLREKKMSEASQMAWMIWWQLNQPACIHVISTHLTTCTIGSLDQKYLASLIIQGPVRCLRGPIKVVNKPNWLSSRSARFDWWCLCDRECRGILYIFCSASGPVRMQRYGGIALWVLFKCQKFYFHPSFGLLVQYHEVRYHIKKKFIIKIIISQNSSLQNFEVKSLSHLTFKV